MKKEILIACSNYYPHSFAGTEVYVKNYADFLEKNGETVYVITSTPNDFITNENIIYEDGVLKVCRYFHLNTMIFGVSYVNEVTTDFIYSKYKKEYTSSWTNFVRQQLEFSSLNILHIHSITATIGFNLFDSIIAQNTEIKTITSYHTPISCPKNTLSYEDQIKDCSLIPDVKVCSRCILKTQDILPYFLAAPLNSLHLKYNKLPSVLKTNYLVKLEIDTFKRLKKITQEWWCYSHGIEKILTINGVERNKIKMIRHGIDGLFLSQKIKKPTDITIYLFTGRLAKIKGVITLLETWLQLPEQEQRILWITSKPDSKNNEISNLIKRTKIRKDIVFLGEKTQYEIAKLYALAHVVIIPSEWYEIGPLVFHEAISCGCSVIASNIGGNRELSDYYSGYSQTFEAGNTNELAAIIQKGIRKKAPVNQPLSFNQHFEYIISKSMIYKTIPTQKLHNNL